MCILHYSQANVIEQNEYGKDHANEHVLTANRLHAFKQMLSRRGLYDPAYGDSWSKYFEKKRELFDPAYGDWANSFKRSDD